LKDISDFFSTSNVNPISLLVLSACETATGDDRDTLGIAGMAVRTKARSTIASLWSIEELTTTRFMEIFYEELINGKQIKVKALQQAMLKLKVANYPPSKWSPYVLVGDWR
jgi:CHAT domain-containing protein